MHTHSSQIAFTRVHIFIYPFTHFPFIRVIPSLRSFIILSPCIYLFKFTNPNIPSMHVIHSLIQSEIRQRSGKKPIRKNSQINVTPYGDFNILPGNTPGVFCGFFWFLPFLLFELFVGGQASCHLSVG